MWKALTDLFESSSDVRKLALKQKLRNIRMGKNEPIVTSLYKIDGMNLEVLERLFHQQIL